MRRTIKLICLLSFLLSINWLEAKAQESAIWGLTPKSSVEILSYETYSIIHIKSAPAATAKLTWICIGSIIEKTIPTLPTHASYTCDGFVAARDNKTQGFADLLLAAKAAESYHILQRLLNKVETIETKINENTSANEKTRASIEQVNKTFMEQLQKSITKRFDNLPAEILNNPTFKAEIEKLKKDIIEDIKKETDNP